MRSRFCLFHLIVWNISLLITTVVSADSQFPPLTLDEAIQLALAQNMQLQSVRDNVTSANIALESARTEFGIKIRPDVSGLLQTGEDLTQRYGVQVSKKFAIGGDLGWQATTYLDKSADSSYRTEVTLRYTQPLLEGWGTLTNTFDVMAAERRTRSQYRTLLLAQQQLVVNVATAYYNILRDQFLVDVNYRAVERARVLLQAAEAKLKVGMASKMDVFRAELQVLAAENGLVDAEESLSHAWRRFNLLLGVDLEARYALVTPLIYEPVELDQAPLIQHALENRLELEEIYEQLAEAEQRVQIARQNIYPPVNLSLHYTLSGEGNGFEKSLDFDDSNWGIGLNSSFAVDFARERGAYQQAQLNYAGTARAVQSREQEIMVDVSDAVTSVQQAQARVVLQEQSVRQAEKQLELAELRYKKGLSDNLDVINAEETVLKAKTGYYSAVAQHIVAKLRLKQAAGTLEVPF